MHAERRRGRSRSRILYYFRTPPGVRVGRSALDEEAIRTIERHNPGVPFDWTRILKGEPAPVVESRPRIDGPERRQRPRVRETGPWAQERPSQPALPPSAPAPIEPILPAIEAAAEEAPAVLEASVQDELAAAAEREGSMAAQTRLGAEGVVRLRARYSEVLARISERATDPAVRDELKRQAERLNPDTWVTDDEVTAGLEQYETVFESLRSVVGRRRKRRRRRGAPGSMEAAGPPPGDGETGSVPDANGGTDDEPDVD